MEQPPANHMAHSKEAAFPRRPNLHVLRRPRNTETAQNQHHFHERAWQCAAFRLANREIRQSPCYPLALANRSIPTSRHTSITCLMFPPAIPRSSSLTKRGEQWHAAASWPCVRPSDLRLSRKIAPKSLAFEIFPSERRGLGGSSSFIVAPSIIPFGNISRKKHWIFPNGKIERHFSIFFPFGIISEPLRETNVSMHRAFQSLSRILVARY